VGNHGRPLEWLVANWDGMVVALIVTFSASTITMALKGARGVTIVISLLSSFMLTGMAVPLAAIYWGLPWYFWPLISGIIGVTSLSLMWFGIRFAERLAQRAPDWADGLGKKVLPEIPDPKADGPKDGSKP